MRPVSLWSQAGEFNLSYKELCRQIFNSYPDIKPQLALILKRRTRLACIPLLTTSIDLGQAV